MAAVGTGPMVRGSEDDDHTRLPNVVERQDALAPVGLKGDGVLISRGDGSGEDGVHAVVLNHQLDVAPHRAAEVARGAQLAFCTGSRDLQGVLAPDRVRLIDGGRHGPGDRGQRVEVQVPGAVGKIDQDSYGGVPAGPGRLDALQERPGVLDDGG